MLAGLKKVCYFIKWTY